MGKADDSWMYGILLLLVGVVCWNCWAPGLPDGWEHTGADVLCVAAQLAGVALIAKGLRSG